ncbi:hypothetical protein JCGZ_07176 [Jatropha curcas]|uniref:Protein kinase domain-containing protein n=2 Tax=Jatropha curcas TaxID=180498 RepID=A0A067KMU5_JATCU|nr:hypothetical protein JCGZ_07176 [Jatropha curcas]
MPCNKSLIQSCPASFYYVPDTISSPQETASLFHVNDTAVNRTVDGFLIRVICSCQTGYNDFTWRMDYLVQPGDSWKRISLQFGSFAVEKTQNKLIAERIITLDFLCGCSENAYLLSYRVKMGDTLFAICSRFKSDLKKTISLNGLENPDLIHDGDILFIPEPVGGLQNLTILEVDSKDAEAKKAPKSRIHILVAGISAAAIIILLAVVLVSWKRFRGKRAQQSKALPQRTDCLDCNQDACPCPGKSEKSTASSLNSDKATVFPYNEILDATSNFSVTLKVGQGSYGSVYHGKLRGMDVAIKQMKDTKSKEFLSELNILCRVHHTNLIELIGYAAGGDSLFLIYEFAQNGALSDHLHIPTSRGHNPLSWITRVQIALDAAKGLEYIHEHTKPYYVHRDVKTSNILLNSNFRAKIADFGLVKLLEHSSDIRAAASRIVGTFGYLAPEYVRDGFVTTKSDVYSFGVVLMELLTGQPAISKDASHGSVEHNEHRSLVQYMLSSLNDTKDPFTQIEKCIDPNLTCFHQDSLCQMALLSKDCVDDNWNRRPDMSIVVLRLSHILLDSRAWDEQQNKHLTG